VARVCKFILIGGCSGALGLPIVVGIVPFLLGFTVGGVVLGTYAATMMRFHKGNIPVGSFVSILQSIGAKGLAAGFNICTVVLGGSLGMAVGGYLAILRYGVCSAKESNVDMNVWLVQIS
jgi:hypothetical protein